MSSRLAAKLRLIAWCIVVSAAIGAVYALLTRATEGGEQPALLAVSRGMLTGALISGLSVSLEIFLLDGKLAAPLRRLPFSAIVAIKTLVYLAVILFSLILTGGRSRLRANRAFVGRISYSRSRYPSPSPSCSASFG
jgi:hypothetical protein